MFDDWMLEGGMFEGGIFEGAKWELGIAGRCEGGMEDWGIAEFGIDGGTAPPMTWLDPSPKPMLADGGTLTGGPVGEIVLMV